MGNDVELTALEYDILVALLRRAGRIIQRNDLLSLEAGRERRARRSERTLDVHISHLRKKIGDEVLSLFFPDDHYQEDWERFRSYVGERFADAWDDPAARDRLARETANDLRVDVRLLDAHGVEIAAFGEHPCLSPRFVTAARRDGEPPVGEVWICPSNEGQHRPAFFVVLALCVACFVLWGITGLAARRIAGPIWDMALVARDIGHGKLGSRARLPHQHHIGEMGLLAESINDMATRIEKQLRDQRELLAAVSHELRTPLGHMRGDPRDDAHPDRDVREGSGRARARGARGGRPRR
jgi:signal transduction histidine kinase